MMMHLRRLQTASSRRRLWISVLLLVFLIGLGSYILWSRHTWTQYEPSYTSWHTGVKSDIDKVLKLPVANSEDRIAVNTQLKRLAQRIDTEQAGVCKVSPLVQWQSQFMKSLAGARERCGTIIENVKSFRQQLDIVTSYNKNDQELAKILSAIPQPTQMDEEAWGDQIAVWNGIVVSIEKMSASEAFEPTRQRAVEKAMAIRTAWEELNAAHQSKDKVKFTAALTTLGASYDALDEVATTSEVAVDDLVQVLQDRYRQAL